MKYWFKNAILYSINVESFQDSNGDGFGDFRGLSDRLEYLSALGVNTLWLLPIFKSPNQDAGYDVADFFNIDPRLGEKGHFVEFLDMADEHHLRVIIDLPLNHTSDKHPWFQESRSNPDSRYRDYYIWQKEKPESGEKKIMFAGQQSGNWKYDEEAEAYYYHTFYDFQPDLNYANPEVLREVRQVMHYWLRLGVSGFRVDALPHIIRNKSSLQKIPQPFEILNKFRQYVEEIKSDAILLGETDVDPSAYSRYFKEEGRFQMLMNFYLANYAFLSLARKEKAPVEFALNMLPQADIFQQYANFLRNHDELDLEQLNESERQQVFDAFAPKENMRIFGRGIRRRLAPMFDNDRRRLELSYSLLFTLQGSPIIRYGDEIGMGDDLSLKGRDSVRTAMQWSDEQNAGFSSASPEDLKVSLIRKGKYGNQKLNVEQQFNDRDSLLQWMMLLCAIRKKCFEFGRGDFNLLDTGHKAVLAHYSRLDKRISLAVHNFSEEEVQVEIKLGDDDVKRLVDVFGDADYDLLKYGSKININPLGYRWFQGVVAKRK